MTEAERLKCNAIRYSRAKAIRRDRIEPRRRRLQTGKRLSTGCLKWQVGRDRTVQLLHLGQELYRRSISPAGVTFDASGNLYGMTGGGGAVW
jgi:hypothetical protein